MVMWAMNRPTLVGPVNITAPEPVRNGDFARLGRVLHRPSFVPTPALALRLALGELADTALLSSLRVLPEAAMAEGFMFRYPRCTVRCGRSRARHPAGGPESSRAQLVASRRQRPRGVASQVSETAL